jgi:hypothetical protein
VDLKKPLNKQHAQEIVTNFVAKHHKQGFGAQVNADAKAAKSTDPKVAAAASQKLRADVEAQLKRSHYIQTNFSAAQQKVLGHVYVDMGLAGEIGPKNATDAQAKAKTPAVPVTASIAPPVPTPRVGGLQPNAAVTTQPKAPATPVTSLRVGTQALVQTAHGAAVTTNLNDARTLARSEPTLPATAASYTAFTGTNPFGTGATPKVDPTATSEGFGDGDCTMLSGLNSVAVQQPQTVIDHLKKLGTTADGKNDVYAVNLFYDNKWQDVAVTSALPVDGQGAHTTNLNQFWQPIYEKAIAKATGSYSADNVDGIEILTGKPTTLLGNYGETKGAPVDITNKALAAFAAGNPVTCNTMAMPGAQGGMKWFDATTGAPAKANARNAIQSVSDHQYCIKGINYDPQGQVSSVEVLNPWNTADFPGGGVFTLSREAFGKIYCAYTMPVTAA